MHAESIFKRPKCKSDVDSIHKVNVMEHEKVCDAPVDWYEYDSVLRLIEEHLHSIECLQVYE